MSAEDPEIAVARARAEALSALAPAAQAAFADAAAAFEALSKSEQAATLAAAYDEQSGHQADQVVEVALDAIRRGRTAAILPRLAEAEAAACLASGATPLPCAGLAQFIRAVAAVLQGQPAPPMPPEYAARLAAICSALTGGS